MNRYHRSIYFPKCSDIFLRNFVDVVNIMPWRISAHALDNLFTRGIQPKDLKITLESQLSADEVFEYYGENDNITKAVFRKSWNDYFDIILVVSDTKTLITAYLNAVNDNHVTLNPLQYSRG